MDKPKKKRLTNDPHNSYWLGYNQALDDWEAFLPTKKEIIEIAFKYYSDKNMPTENVEILEGIAKAISKRLRT